MIVGDVMSEKVYLDYVEKLSVPLYKYYGNLEYAKDVIKNRRIHFESPKDYNDIFDSATYITDEQIGEIECPASILINTVGVCVSYEEKTKFDNDFVSCFNPDDDISIKALLDVFFKLFPDVDKKEVFMVLRVVMSLQHITTSDTMKISCFSENRDSLLMWAYYANAHKGVCLEFDLKNDMVLSKHCHKVQYTKHFDVGDFSYTYFAKGEQWQHEQEWRVVNNGFEYEHTDTLKAIYLGFKMDDDEKMEFVRLAKEFKLDLYYVKPSSTEYKLEFVRMFKNGELSVEDKA